MKLKKVTALLLATSMVLSSVSVGTFADELIFEPEVSVTTEAGEDEAYFGDDVVTGDEQNEEDSASDETFFADEVIEDDQVNDDVIAEDSAADQEAYAFEEDAFVGNEDVLEAIASEDEAYEETVVTAGEIADVEWVYNGSNAVIDSSSLASLGDVVQFWHTIPDTIDYANAAEPAADSANWTSKPLAIKKVIQSTGLEGADDYYWARVLKDNKVVKTVSFKVVVKPATVTATLKDKEFTWGNVTNGTLTIADFDLTGLVTGDTITGTKAFSPAVNWQEIPTPDGKTLKTANAGDYTIADSAFADVVAEPNAGTNATSMHPSGAYYPNYKIQFKGGKVKIKKYTPAVTLTWKIDNAAKTSVPYDENQHTVTAETATQITYYGADKAIETVGLKNNKAVEAGTYTAEVTKVALAGSAEDILPNIDIVNPTFEWKIVGKPVARVYLGESADALTAYYGETPEAVLKKVDATKIKYQTQNETTGVWADNAAVAATITGTATFRTNYEQYANVTETTKGYSVWYVSGLQSDDYQIVPYDDPTAVKCIKVVPAPVNVTADSIIVGIDAEPADLTDKYDVTDGKASNKTISGTAAALKRDIKDGRIKVSLTTTPDKPSAIGKYPINVKFENTSTTDKAIQNFKFALHDKTADGDYATPGTNVKDTTVVDPDKYTVTWGDFKLTFDDYKGGYDGKEHGIVMDPEKDDLPASITVYFAKHDWTDDELAAGAMLDANVPTSWAPATRDATAFKAKSVSSTTMPTRTEVGKSTVYYYVESSDYQAGGTGLSEWGSKTITITSAVQAVEDKIDEATTKDASGKYDADKVKEARDAYEALSADEKKQVPVSKLRKLEDAEAAVKDEVDAKAAKAVEDEIDKLPAATEATAADKEAADKAVEDYNKLTEDQKKLVPEDKVKKMNDVKAAADAAAEGDAKKAAKAVEDEIAALPAAADAKASDKAAADKAKADYDALTDAQKALVPAEAVDKMNAVKAAADEAAKKEEEAKEEVAALDEKVAAVKAAKNGADGKKAAEDAKEAYDKLSDEAKALMTDEEKAAYEASQEAYKKDKTFESGEGVFRVLSNGEVTFTKPLHPENTWFVVPNQVKKNGFMYKVVKVSTKAFMGCEKATKIKIGKNVQSIGGYAFKNTPAMGKLIMLTSKLASGKVKDSFVGAGKEKGAKLTNEVPSGKSSAYESLFKGEGGMNAGAKFTEAN